MLSIVIGASIVSSDIKCVSIILKYISDVKARPDGLIFVPAGLIGGLLFEPCMPLKYYRGVFDGRPSNNLP